MAMLPETGSAGSGGSGDDLLVLHVCCAASVCCMRLLRIHMQHEQSASGLPNQIVKFLMTI